MCSALPRESGGSRTATPAECNTIQHNTIQYTHRLTRSSSVSGQPSCHFPFPFLSLLVAPVSSLLFFSFLFSHLLALASLAALSIYLSSRTVGLLSSGCGLQLLYLPTLRVRLCRASAMEATAGRGLFRGGISFFFLHPPLGLAGRAGRQAGRGAWERGQTSDGPRSTLPHRDWVGINRYQ